MYEIKNEEKRTLRKIPISVKCEITKQIRNNRKIRKLEKKSFKCFLVKRNEMKHTLFKNLSHFIRIFAIY